MTPQIAIIVLHYKNLADTKDCLRSLRRQDYPNYSVIVVNNDSPDHAEGLRAEFGGFITIIQNDENLGFSEGNNVGIRAALADDKTDAVLILNNDTEVEPNFLSQMAHKLSPPFQGGEGVVAKGGVDMVAPRIMRSDNREQVDNIGLTLMSSGLAFNRRKESEKLFCPSGAAALYSRELLETITFAKGGVIASEGRLGRPGRSNLLGALNINSSDDNLNGDVQIASPRQGGARNDIRYFDPSFFAYCEDWDLGWRARLAGFTAAYADKAIVYHKGSAATKPMSDFAVYHTYRNLLWTHFKNMPLALLLWQSPWLAAGWLFLFALYTLKGRPGIILSAFWDGLLGLRFMLKKRREVQSRRAVSNKEILSWFATGLFPKSYLH